MWRRLTASASEQRACFPLTYPHPAWKHSAIWLKSSPSSPVPTSYLSTRKIFSIKVNIGMKEKGEVKGGQGRRQRILGFSLWTQQQCIAQKSRGHMRNCRDLLFGARVGGNISGSSPRASGSWGRSSRPARAEQWDALKPGQTNTPGIFCCCFPFFISFSEVGSFEQLLKISSFKKSYSVKPVAEEQQFTGVTNKKMLLS